MSSLWLLCALIAAPHVLPSPFLVKLKARKATAGALPDGLADRTTTGGEVNVDLYGTWLNFKRWIRPIPGSFLDDPLFKQQDWLPMTGTMASTGSRFEQPHLTIGLSSAPTTGGFTSSAGGDISSASITPAGDLTSDDGANTGLGMYSEQTKAAKYACLC